MQFIRVNRVFNDANLRETLLGIQLGAEVYEYPILDPELEFIDGYPAAFIGQTQQEALFAYTTVRRPNQNRSIALAIVQLPLTRQLARFVYLGDASEWSIELVGSRQLNLAENHAAELCYRYRDLSEAIFDKACNY